MGLSYFRSKRLRLGYLFGSLLSLFQACTLSEPPIFSKISETLPQTSAPAPLFSSLSSPSPIHSLLSSPSPSPSPSSSVSVVCDPLASVTSPSVSKAQNGIKGKLYYFTDVTQIQEAGLNPSSLLVNDFFKYGTLAPADFYFSSFNAPPQNLGQSQGFGTQTGGVLKTSAGQVLYQYFALKFTGYLTLPPSIKEPQTKEFAVISDDGSVVNIQHSAVVINNDGLRCASVKYGSGSILLQPNQTVEFELDFFQGPAPGLTLGLFWRTVTQASSTAYPSFPMFCGGSNPPALNLGQDWELVPPEAFVLSPTTIEQSPGPSEINPCATSAPNPVASPT